jgi:DNA-binding MarR family transcriptional regulator
VRLRRNAAAADQRAKRISLTPKATALLAAAVPIVEAFDRDFFGT